MKQGRRWGTFRRAPVAVAVALLGAGLATQLAGQAVTYPAVTEQIRVDGAPVGVAVNPATHKVYVAASADNLVDVVDANTNKVVKRIATGALPYGIAVDPTANRAYVALGTAHGLGVIDGATDTLLTTIALPSGPNFVAVDAPNHRAYVSMPSANSVAVIDTLTNSVVGTPIGVGAGPQGVVVNPTANRIYVANGTDNNVTVLDRVTNVPVTTITVGAQPQLIAVDATTNRAYVANFNGASVSVIDGSNNTVIGTIAVGLHPLGVAVNPALHRLYVSNFDANTATLIDTANNSVVATLTSFVNPFGIDVLPDFKTAYVADNQNVTLTVITEFVDVTPPHTTITGGPPALTATTSASFTFTVTDDLASAAHITSECKVDAGAFAPCITGVSFGGLTDGSHTFSVRSTDESGNVETSPATRSWTIDATPPDTTITQSPSDPSNSVRAIVTFTGTDNTTATANLRYDCRLDNFPNFLPCLSGGELYALLPGLHTYRVRAIDALGNIDPTPAVATWTVVDKTAPLTSFDTASTGSILLNSTNLVVLTPVFGFATDDVAGIDHIDLTFVPQPGPLQPIDRTISLRLELGRDILCSDVTNTSCRWHAPPSVLPGTYRVYVVATDRSGSSHAVQSVPTPPITVTVI
jgi:YVTN family beta-propeller protein